MQPRIVAYLIGLFVVVFASGLEVQAQTKSGMGPRGDVILQFDACLGRIMDVLDRLGLTEDTLLMVSSDNGPVVDDGYRDEAVARLGDHRPAGRDGQHA